MTANRRLRILHVGKFYPPYMGGMETHLQALCAELRKTVDVKVVVANAGKESTEEMVDGVEVNRAGTLFNLASAPVCPSMVQKIRDEKADIVHMHLPNPTAILAYLMSGHTGRLVFTYHSDTVRQKVLGKAFAPILRRALKQSAAIIATSPNYVESSPVLSDFKDRCRVIPYGIPISQFEECDVSEVARIRARYGPRIVISVGRLIYYKGFEYLIRAMAKVDARLLIVGDGPLRADLEREARAYGVSDKVVFLGEIQNSEIVPYYYAADLFALASIARSEAFGIVQLEAMACGKPVVNTSLASGVPFVSLDGMTGITVPPQDSEALSSAINLLLDDPVLRAAYGDAARSRVREKFSLQGMVASTLHLYEQVTNSFTAPNKVSVATPA
jgi:glycosyltransferase involved in cell wall biosynthesis